MSTMMIESTATTTRVRYLDSLRAALIVLVIVHHIAMIYGAAAPFYYVEPPSFTQFRAFRALLVLILFNQSFFMGALFLIAGYFTPGSYDRKGASSFVKGKLIRLGVPLLVFYFVLNPVTGLATYLMPTSLTGITRPPSWSDYPGMIGLGPLWFVAMLLVFDAGYLVFRMVSERRGERRGKVGFRGPGVIGPVGVVGTMVALAAVSFIWRTIVPMGKTIVGFPTLSYLPQYLGFFVLGIVAFRRGWLGTLRVSLGVLGGALALCAAVLLFPLAFSGGMFDLSVTPGLSRAFGDGHWRSAVYAAWDSVFSVGIVLALLVVFRELIHRRTRFGAIIAEQSYAVYIVHVTVIVYGSYLLRSLDLATIPKFLLATAIFVPISFFAAWGIRRVPGVSKVL